MWGWQRARRWSNKSILTVTLLEISNSPDSLSTTSVSLPLVLPAWMEELVKTKNYLQGDHPTHVWGKRKQRSSAPDVPLSAEEELKPFSAPYAAPTGSTQQRLLVGAWASKLPSPLEFRTGSLISLSPHSLLSKEFSWKKLIHPLLFKGLSATFIWCVPKRQTAGSASNLKRQSHLRECPDFSNETLPEGKREMHHAPIPGSGVAHWASHSQSLKA